MKNFSRACLALFWALIGLWQLSDFNFRALSIKRRQRARFILRIEKNCALCALAAGSRR